VLVVVAMLALVFLAAVSALDTLSRQTLRAKARVRFEQAASSLEARAAWLAATEPLSEDAVLIGAPRAESATRPDPRQDSIRREVIPLHLDGRAYRAGDPREPLSVSLQDAAGQINLDQMPEPAKARLVAALGAPPGERARLVDRLDDWLDPDALERLNGAERPDYAAAGLAAPRDGPMTRVTAVLGVLGWTKAVPREGWLALRDALTVDPRATAFNVNTAPPAALAVMLGLSPAQVEAARAARESHPFASMADFTAAIGPIPYDNEAPWTHPDGRFSLKVASPARRLVFRSRIVLTPQSPERPLWIAERSISSASGQDPTGLPPDALAFPDPAR
jgi:type II secretory pathway component PulK